MSLSTRIPAHDSLLTTWLRLPPSGFGARLPNLGSVLAEPRIRIPARLRHLPGLRLRPFGRAKPARPKRPTATARACRVARVARSLHRTARPPLPHPTTARAPGGPCVEGGEAGEDSLRLLRRPSGLPARGKNPPAPEASGAAQQPRGWVSPPFLAGWVTAAGPGILPGPRCLLAARPAPPNPKTRARAVRTRFRYLGTSASVSIIRLAASR